MNSSHIDLETLIHFTNQFEKSPKAIDSKLIWQCAHDMGQIAKIDFEFKRIDVKKYGQI